MILQLTIISSVFSIIRQLANPDPKIEDLFKYPPHVCMILVQYFTKSVIIIACDQTTKEAEKTSSIVARIMVGSDDRETKDLLKFLAQIRSRNLKVQNVFFVHDWRFILTVS
jgi:hypothetical protein